MIVEKHGTLIILSGPSGAGKSTIISNVIAKRNDLSFSVSATTRQPRQGEKEGTNYYFTNREEFLKMVSEGKFLEYAEYAGSLYGTPKAPVLDILSSGKSVILDIETKGAEQVKKSMPEAVTVFIIPPSLSELESRLIQRNQNSYENISRRMEIARSEYEVAESYDYVVVNADHREAEYELDSIITAEKCRTANRIELIRRK